MILADKLNYYRMLCITIIHFSVIIGFLIQKNMGLDTNILSIYPGGGGVTQHLESPTSHIF